MALNQFSFVCPIFNATTTFVSCMQLKGMVWMGRRPDVRRGCQACMNSSKCPIVAIVSRADTRNLDLAAYYSATPVVGKLDAEVLQRILPIVVREEHLRQRQVSDQERLLIETANQRIEQQLGTAPSSEKVALRSARSISRPAPAAPKARPAVNKTVTDAAVSGDMSAAINV